MKSPSIEPNPPLDLLSRAVILVSIALSVWLFSGTLLDPDAVQKRRSIQGTIVAMSQQNAELRHEISELRAHIEALKQREDVLETTIRQRLGYIKEGELVLEYGESTP